MGSHVTVEGLGQPEFLPEWVPAGALHYIAHTEMGQPIRSLARAAGCHASTILRQIRKLEMRRDDPLVDAALRKLGAVQAQGDPKMHGKPKIPCDRKMTPVARKDAKAMIHSKNQTADQTMPDETTLAREGMRVLRRLCETGAVLAVAAELDKAVVVRDGPDGSSTRTAVVEAAVAQAMALKDWITPANEGRIVRYHITSAGRTALAAFLERFGAPAEAATGFAESAMPFGRDQALDKLAQNSAQNGRPRMAIGESPLAALARRRDKDGQRFLEDALVQSGERLREDFELAQMDGSVTQNWDHFLTAGTQGGASGACGGTGAPAEARARVKAALIDLGPGLSDVVLRCCCYLEGLETTEKRLGWSARSGKVVLRIALMRLKRHYDETVGPGGVMIG